MAPRPERRWLRGLVRLQACVRGYLVRRQLRAARAEFEAVVLLVEGSLERLRWRGRHLLRPVFLDELPGEQPAEVNCAATEETGWSDKSNPDELQQEVPPSGASAPERAQGGGSDVKLVESSEAAAREGDEERPGAEAGDIKPAAEGSSAPAQGEERESRERESREPSAWDVGAVREAGLEIPLEELQELPRTVPGLLAYRNHLLMELLWLEQAIVSRKNYLRLKKKLVAADLQESIPGDAGSLYGCGEAAELENFSSTG